MTARERLQLMIRTDRGCMTVWSPAEVRDAFAAYDAERRAEVLREAGDALEQRSVELGFDSGLSAGAGILWRMADAATPTSKEQS